jgi:DNA-binding transcriptional MerR regulator
MPEALKIGAVATRTGLSIDTIRFYEREGLLNAPIRSEGGFRLFQEKDVEVLRLIRCGQSLGFSLQEIRELLFVRNGMCAPCADVKRLLEQKLAAVRQRVSEMVEMERDIATALQKCKRALRASTRKTTESCPVLGVNRPRVVTKK